MKKYIFAIITLLTINSVSFSQSATGEISIIPKPVELVQTKGSLNLKKRGAVELSGADISLASVLNDFLDTKKAPAVSKGYPVKLAVVKNSVLGNEGYKL
jgi:hypothetical protein